MDFLPIKRFVLVLCVLVSCSNTADTSPVLASIGDSTYTENKALADGATNPVSAHFIDRWIEREVLYQSALRNAYDKDIKTQQQSINHLKHIVGQSYLETLVQSRITITEAEIVNYYEKTRVQYKRADREAVILHFSFTDITTANKLASGLKKNATGGGNKNLGGLLATHKPQRELVFEKRLKESLRKKVFSAQSGTGVVGPIRIGNKFYVINVLKVFEKGTIKDMIHVQDQIQRKLFELKKRTLEKNILDSLKAVYSVDIIN